MPPSSITNSSERPSGAKRGEITLRSSAAVSGRGAPPAAGTIATWFAPYHMSFGSPPSTKAIHCPSGLHVGLESSLGPVAIPRGTSPSFAATTKMSLFCERSGSGSVRLLTKATRWPSGDQVGSESSKRPDVSWNDVFLATSKTWTCERSSRRYPSPSRLNWMRRSTIGFAGLPFSVAGSSSSSATGGASGSSSETMSAIRFESGDQARSDTSAL